MAKIRPETLPVKIVAIITIAVRISHTLIDSFLILKNLEPLATRNAFVSVIIAANISKILILIILLYHENSPSTNKKEPG